MSNILKDNVSRTSTWIRLVYSLVYLAVSYLVGILIVLISLIQFCLKLLLGQANVRLRQLGGDLGLYLADVVSFVTFHSDAKPYPFGPWPSSAAAPSPPAGKQKAKAASGSPKARSGATKPRRPAAKRTKKKS